MHGAKCLSQESLRWLLWCTCVSASALRASPVPSKKGRKKTDNPNEGWAEDRVPTYLPARQDFWKDRIRDTGEREEWGAHRDTEREGWAGFTHTPGIPLSYSRIGRTKLHPAARRHGGRRGPPTGCALLVLLLLTVLCDGGLGNLLRTRQSRAQWRAMEAL